MRTTCRCPTSRSSCRCKGRRAGAGAPYERGRATRRDAAPPRGTAARRLGYELLGLGLVLGAGASMTGTACDRHPPEASRSASVQPESYPDDPHVFGCAGCHGADPAAPVANLRATCTRSGCHPQAWTRTVFHRVDPSVFTNCTNCHLPHAWVANGDDCASCHAALRGPEGTVAVHAFAATSAFPHDRHARLDCSVCHRV